MTAWEKNIRRVIPYVPGEQPKETNIIKLNTNENPYDPSPRVMQKQMELSVLKKYPDPTASALVDALAAYHHVSNKNVFVGVGSDDVLAMSFLTFFNSTEPILFPDITYSFYDVWADLFKIPYRTVAVDDSFKIHAKDYYGENGGIVIANPNAPTGIAEPLSFIEDILEHNKDVVVIVDEAYVDFGGESALALVDKYDNLLVVRTYSKSRSMAGVRIGYAIGNEKLINYLNDVKYSYNSYTMNYPSIVLGVESIADEDYFRESIAKVIKTREWFTLQIEQLGFSCPKSSTNFVFATHKSIPAKEIYEKAKENKIIVRYFNKPRIDNYLRITIGTQEEMQIFVDFLKKLTDEAC
ncbi:MAG: histidinol-phosphate transaminase [Eubacteriales bacterium]|nr:histidinol-phosphate transaminase [Lachnospiraceae bacterium]MDO5127512.1 histidinol-phosphate transaminase [Eubacteriales bacterium]